MKWHHYETNKTNLIPYKISITARCMLLIADFIRGCIWPVPLENTPIQFSGMLGLSSVTITVWQQTKHEFLGNINLRIAVLTLWRASCWSCPSNPKDADSWIVKGLFTRQMLRTDASAIQGYFVRRCRYLRGFSKYNSMLYMFSWHFGYNHLHQTHTTS